MGVKIGSTLITGITFSITESRVDEVDILISNLIVANKSGSGIPQLVDIIANFIILLYTIQRSNFDNIISSILSNIEVTLATISKSLKM